MVRKFDKLPQHSALIELILCIFNKQFLSEHCLLWHQPQRISIYLENAQLKFREHVKFSMSIIFTYCYFDAIVPACTYTLITCLSMTYHVFYSICMLPIISASNGDTQLHTEFYMLCLYATHTCIFVCT